MCAGTAPRPGFNHVVPQREFVIPSGFLEPRGVNTVALTVTAERTGVGPDPVRLVNQVTVLGGVGGGQDPAPDCADLFTR
ncbi:hypothetical protein ABZ565_05770 [Streptomyces sp. NPDC016469]|uniref:hypothetical protein n=1 Tax=Streptomyces sp. NPDC016469 TaxID=3157191 RepID=UPI0033DBE0E7